MSKLALFIETHDFPCWCGHTQSKLACKQMFGRRHFAVLACSHCGTNRILPRALQSQVSAAELYNVYEGHEVMSAGETDYLDQMFERLSSVGVVLRTGTKVLDVGCGSGVLLEAICQKFGCKGKGIDVDRRRIAKAQNRSKRAVFECGLFDPTKVTHQYDVVISSAVVEHVLNPVEFLKQLATVIPPDGSLFLLTPNAASINYKLLKSWWRELLSIGEHIYLFTPASLSVCAAEAGFETLSSASDFDPSHPQLNFDSLRNMVISAWAQYCKAIKRLAKSMASSQTGDILYAHFKKK